MNNAYDIAPKATLPPTTRRITLSFGTHCFAGHLEMETAPASCAWLMQLLPLHGRVMHARWSGEAGWVPLGSQVPLAPENATVYPQMGQVLLYSGGFSEPELLISYGACAFACKAGNLAGNHVITLEGDLTRLREIGQDLLCSGSEEFQLALT